MINRNETGLLIFDNFTIDSKLPKYNKQRRTTQSADDAMMDPAGGTWVNGGIQQGFSNNVPTVANVMFEGARIAFTRFTENGDKVLVYDNDGNIRYKKDTIFLRLKLMFRFLFKKKMSKPEHVPTITVQEYFRSIKMSCEEIQKLDDRMNGYVTAVHHAEEFGQTALADDLKSRMEVIKLESRMFSMNLTKVITEEQVINFYKEAEKGIQLYFIRNFARIIPASLLEIKKRADELEIFDNYVIMTYDPGTKSYKQTQQEKEQEEAKRKDPILFGLIRNSRKLYYIGSWEDEFCDLTLEKFIEKFGEEAINKNDINVNQF